MSVFEALGDQLEELLRDLEQDGEDVVKRYSQEIAARVASAHASTDWGAATSLQQTIEMLAGFQLGRARSKAVQSRLPIIMQLVSFALRVAGVPA